MSNHKARKPASEAPRPAVSIRPTEEVENSAPRSDQDWPTQPVPDPAGAQFAAPKDMFEAKFHRLMDGFGAGCEAEQVQLAVAIALDPDSKQPMVFTRGENYDLLRMMKWVYTRLRGELLEELSL